MTDSQRWMIISIAAMSFMLFYYLSAVLTPFIVAAFFAYLLNPIVDRMGRWLPRTVAVAVIFLLAFILLLIAVLALLPQVNHQIHLFSGFCLEVLNWIQTQVLPWLHENTMLGDIAKPLELTDSVNQYWQQVGRIASSVVNTLSNSGLAVFGFFANLFLMPVVTFYLLRDWHIFIAGTHSLLPRFAENTVVSLVQECDVVLAAFFRGQLMVMLVLAIYYFSGLWLVGLKLALSIGVLAGAVSIIPYMGFALGLISASTAVLLQYSDATHLVYVLLVFLFGHLLEGSILTPVLLGDQIGLHPVAVIFAILVGGHLFGFIGILTALPIAAVIMVLLRHINRQYQISELRVLSDG